MNPWYLIVLYSIAFLTLIISTLISLIRLTKSYIKKKLNTRIIMYFILSVVLLTGVVLFYASHSTYYKYNDWLILGRSIDEVQKIYGEFDLNYRPGIKGYYIYTDNSPIMPDYLKHYYYVEYDENGTIYNVYDAGQPGG